MPTHTICGGGVAGHSTEEAFMLLNQLPRVQIPAHTIFFLLDIFLLESCLSLILSSWTV